MSRAYDPQKVEFEKYSDKIYFYFYILRNFRNKYFYVKEYQYVIDNLESNENNNEMIVIEYQCFNQYFCALINH